MTELIESKASRVTFFEDRAQVTRKATVQASAGRSLVSLSGITVLIADSSLVARVTSGKARVLTARVHRTLQTRRHGTDSEIRELEDKVRELSQTLDAHRRKLTRCNQATERAAAMEEDTLGQMRFAPPQIGPDGWVGALEKLDEEYLELEKQYAELTESVAQARREQARATALLNEARKESPEITARVEIELDAEGDGEIEVEIEYFTPCALWRPSYVARLSEDRTEVRVTTLGTAWQNTGENWSRVQCRFSTARPTEAAEAPLIHDDWLRARPKTEEERRVLNVEARDVDISSTGSELAGQVEQMPGVDDGGEPLMLESRDLVSIPSNGEPFRVEVRSFTAKCRADVVAYPERSNVPFIRARGTWNDELPILAGPVVIMRGNDYAGRTRIDFTGPGETFELGFGVESGVSVHRTIEDEHKTTAVTGKNVLHRTVKVFLSNLSGETQHLTLVERVPVSEIEEVSVKKVNAATQPDADGYVEYGVKLSPHQVSTEVVNYRVEYGSKVRLSW